MGSISNPEERKEAMASLPKGGHRSYIKVGGRHSTRLKKEATQYTTLVRWV